MKMIEYVHIALLSIWFLVCVALAMSMGAACFYGVYLAGVAFFSLPTHIWVSGVVALFAVGGCMAYIDIREDSEQHCLRLREQPAKPKSVNDLDLDSGCDFSYDRSLVCFSV